MSAASREISLETSAERAPDTQHHPSAIRTVLTEFSGSFQNAMRPILVPLRDVGEALAAAPDDLPARQLLPAVRDLRHQLESLVDKVTEQEGYVLIFGPLKSGKSTFMNALSAAYVSEVTSLPAYPCMVHVSHADEPGFVLTHYDGRTTKFTQREALSEVVSNAHHELTRRIRDVEVEGQGFDPAVHRPEAIRRIDVRIGIDDLAQSGAVLVDTPGLYTRMKFGYQQMSRDFRNSAACAIFIVKTDNLFLEQVFDEFGELLELFSRIFLVVNIDSTKNDLQPDGSLIPSLEQRNPWEIIEAFESLSMTASLKKAVDDGRLDIYPVDLLRAASQRLSGRSGAPDQDETDSEERARSGFDDVLRDLTDFLNSNEYLNAFIKDSMDRSRALVDEVGAILGDDSARRLDGEIDALRAARAEAGAQLDKAGRLAVLPWRAHAENLAPAVSSGGHEFAAQLKADAAATIERHANEWFEDSSSLQHLLEERLHPLFASAQASLIGHAEQILSERTSTHVGEMTATENVVADVESLGVDLASISSAALDRLKGRTLAYSPYPRISTEAIPVRRTASDWLLLRRSSTVRERLFGPAEQPGAELSESAKQRFLGDRGRRVIIDTAIAELDGLLEQTVDSLWEQLVRGYADNFEADLREQLEAIESEVRQTKQSAEQRLHSLQAVRAGMYSLGAKHEKVSPAVDALVARFVDGAGADDDDR